MQHDDVESVSEPWRSHLLEPRHTGVLEGADVRRGEARNAACGDVLELFGAWRGGILVVRFRGRGCWAVVACASLLCERIDGLPPDAARAFEARAAVEEVGGLPRSRRHAVLMFERAFAALFPAVSP